MLERDHLVDAVLGDLGGERVDALARHHRDTLPPRLRAISRPALIATSVVLGNWPC